MIVEESFEAPFGPIPELRLSFVPRWCIVKTTKTQSVAEHSYNVAVIAEKLCRVIGLGDAETGMAVREALFHDKYEVYTGDIPSPAKHREEKDAICPLLSLIVKLADLIEAYIFISNNSADSEKVTSWVTAPMLLNIANMSRSISQELYEYSMELCKECIL
jgi:hypothetical protein